MDHQDDLNDVPSSGINDFDVYLDNAQDNELPQLNQVFPEFYDNVLPRLPGLGGGRNLDWPPIPEVNNDDLRRRQIGIDQLERASRSNLPFVVQSLPHLLDGNEIINGGEPVQFQRLDEAIVSHYNQFVNPSPREPSLPQWHEAEEEYEFNDETFAAFNNYQRADGRVIPLPDFRQAPAPEWFQHIEAIDHDDQEPPQVDPSVNSDDATSAEDEDEDPFAHINFPATPQDPHEPQHNNEPIDLTSSSPPPNMPPTNATKKRKRTPNISASASSAKVERDAQPPKTRKDSVEVVDLEDIEEKEEYEAFKARQQAEAIKKQNEEEANKPVKLAEFQCIICMDQPTDLTVTHCGHLFCGECLHSALHAGDKKCCPVCRSTITLTPNRKSKHGVFPLQMKLMTAVRKGKQPVKT